MTMRRQRTQTVFNMTNISNEQISDSDLLNFTGAQRRKLVFVFNLALKSSELSFFSPVIKRRHEHDHQHRHQDRDTFNPARL